MRAILWCVFLVFCSSGAFAQGTQCRTSPVGSSTSYCASEAFVTQSTAGAGDVTGPSSSTAGHIATFADTTGKIIQDGGAPGSGNVTSSGTPVLNQIAQWVSSTAIAGTNLASLLIAGVGISITGSTSPTIALALNNVIVQSGTLSGFSTSTSGMAGYGVAGCSITPNHSGRVRFDIQGSMGNNTASNETTVVLKFGTGTGPSSGAAVTGTTVGSPETSNDLPSGGGNQVPFHLSGYVTGQTPGAALWFDAALGAAANTSSIATASCSAQEID